MITPLVFTLSFAFASDVPPADAALARATRSVDAECPHLGDRLYEAFGILAESASVGLLALYETPSALFEYLVADAKSAAEDRHEYFPTTEDYARDVRLRYRALLEGSGSPECLRAMCAVERLRRPDHHAASAPCRRVGAGG